MQLAWFPHINAAGQYGPKKYPDGFYWGVQFELSPPANHDGYVIQEVSQTFTGTNSTGARADVSKQRYWEAWEIKRGAFGTVLSSKMTVAASMGATTSGASPLPSSLYVPVDDIFFFKVLPGATGTIIFVASAAFYEGPLPSTFTRHNPSTGAGKLLSTTTKPAFWEKKGLCRVLRFEYDLRPGAGTSTLGTYQLPVGTVDHVNPSWPGDFTIHS